MNRTTKRESSRGKVGAAVLLLGIAVWAGGIVRADEAAGGPVELKKLEVFESDGVYKLHVVGRSTLPNLTRLRLEILFHGERGPTEELEVRGGRFELLMPLEGEEVLAGTYDVRIALNPRDQRRKLMAELADVKVDLRGTFQIGTEEEAKHDLETVRSQYVQILEQMRRAWLELSTQGSYSANAVGILRLKGDREGMEKAFQAWQTVDRRYWDELYLKQARLELVRLRKRLFMTPLPEVDAALGHLVGLMERWHASLLINLYENAGKKPPESTDLGVVLRGHGELALEVPRAAKEVCRLLEFPFLNWTGVDLAAQEEGYINGDHYESYTAKFAISKPGPDWVFDRTPTSPLIRLRIRPKDERLNETIVCAVEIQDYPTSQSFEDLERLTQRAAENRFTGYQRISAEPIKVRDLTMEETGGMRPGFVHTFRTSANIRGVRRTFICHQYDLFCRWAKRTYTVMSFMPEEEWERLEPVIEKITSSFKVLDDPDYELERLREKQRREREEERKRAEGGAGEEEPAGETERK